MSNFLRTFILVLIISSCASAKDEVGAVVLSKSSKYVVKTTLGFTVCEWFGGNDLNEGDVVVGNLHQFGFTTLALVRGTSVTTTTTRVWVDNFWLDKDRVIDWLVDKGLVNLRKDNMSLSLLLNIKSRRLGRSPRGMDPRGFKVEQTC